MQHLNNRNEMKLFSIKCYVYHKNVYKISCLNKKSDKIKYIESHCNYKSNMVIIMSFFEHESSRNDIITYMILKRYVF